MDIATILTRKYPGKEWTLNGDDYTGLEWLSSGKAPTEKELEDLWPVVVQEIEDEKAAKEAAKQSAVDKLAALGLSAEEVKELFGIEV
jgi:hypothetical protein